MAVPTILYGYRNWLPSLEYLSTKYLSIHAEFKLLWYEAAERTG